MKKLLIVEDDVLLNDTLKLNLQLDGYTAEGVFTCQEAEQALQKETYDLIILDVNLPDGSGFALCKTLKAAYKEPILFLTANDMEESMVKGFELGADDYVTKPFSIPVLMLKIKAILSRLDTQRKRDVFDDGHLHIDFLELTASVHGAPLALTPLEYRILKLLTENTNIVLTRQVLLERLWDIDQNFVDEHTLTAAISRIRSKVEAGGASYIKTVYGMGYMWMGARK